MAPRTSVDIGRMFDRKTPIDAALRRAAREAIRLHKRAGLPVVIWRHGRATWVDPDDLDGRRGGRRPKRRR
ncbi:MAG: hypothetical protein HYY93_11250 [Planctomycetes bacterium]|nr:hypothetical protein [Planctomycetota bacterium]